MENKELYKIDLGKKEVTDVIIDGSIIIKYGDGEEISLEDYHDQDCCESVYADYDNLDQLREIKGKEIGEFIIKGVENVGFLLCVARTKVFIPCYNSQNGYYSSSLSLKIENGANTTEIDISDYLVQDEID